VAVTTPTEASPAFVPAADVDHAFGFCPFFRI
jgi:hypothetical protein